MITFFYEIELTPRFFMTDKRHMFEMKTAWACFYDYEGAGAGSA